MRKPCSRDGGDPEKCCERHRHAPEQQGERAFLEFLKDELLEQIYSNL